MSEAVIKSKVTADTSQFEGGVKKASATAESFKGQMGKIGGAIKAAFAVATIQQFASSITDALSAAENKMDAMGDFAFETGMTPENAQALSVMAEQFGVGSDKLAGMIAKLRESKAEMEGSTDEAGRLQLAFAGLGMSFDEVRAMSPGDLFVALAQKLAAFQGDADRTKAAMELLGATGAMGGRMTEFLKAAGGGGIQSVIDQLSGAGALVTQADLDRADRATNNAIMQQQVDMMRSSRTRVFQPIAGTIGADAAGIGKDIMTMNISGLLSKTAQGFGATVNILKGIEKNTAGGAKF